jgi:hypothetical protein
MCRDLFNADASTAGRQQFELHRSAPLVAGTLSAGGHTSMDQSMKDDDVEMKDYDDLDDMRDDDDLDKDMKDDSDVDEDIDDGDTVEDMKDDDDFDKDINNTPATDRLSDEIKFSDGEIYRNIRYALQSARIDLVQGWMTQLTGGKQDDLDRLLKNNSLVKAFDMLLPFPGLWCGLELGNIRNHLALHCDEELLCYLRHIYSTWNQITLNNTAIQQAVDIQTVKTLELRAPSASIIDHYHIMREMDSGALFPNITERNVREFIKQALLRLEVIIPTIKSFHENLKYLEIGANILKTHLLDTGVRTTLYKTMCSMWSQPENVLVEFQEGVYRHATLREGELPVDVAYKQVFISALRQFPSLSNDVPRWEPRHEAIKGTTDPAYHLLFLNRAQLLGFRTEKVLQGIMNAPEVVEAPDSEPCAGSHGGEGKEWRSGRPFRGAYKQSRTQLFLPNLAEAARVEVSLNPSVLFVQQDFVNAFFGMKDR